MAAPATTHTTAPPSTTPPASTAMAAPATTNTTAPQPEATAQTACGALADVLRATSKFTESGNYEEQKTMSLALTGEILAALESVQTPPAEIESVLGAQIEGWRIVIQAFEESADAASFITNLQRLAREEFASDAEVEGNDAVINAWAEANCGIKLNQKSYFGIDN